MPKVFAQFHDRSSTQDSGSASATRSSSTGVPRRGGTFMTGQVTSAVAAALTDELEHIFLNNLDAGRDWGYAPGYVEVTWRMPHEPSPDDHVIPTGEIHSDREVCETAFSLVAVGWERYLRVDQGYLRPTEVEELCGDESKAAAKLGWRAETRVRDSLAQVLEADSEQSGKGVPNATTTMHQRAGSR